jgi:hypothetical protein
MEVNINKGYELYQIITDFGEPLEIFREAFQNAIDECASEVYCSVYEEKKLSGNTLIVEVWNNGYGLPKDKINCFFDLAYSTKIDENKIPVKGKLGYKGHGSKIFFNSESVTICSKNSDGLYCAKADNPIAQIDRSNTFFYDFINSETSGINFPSNWDQGFYIRIAGHLHFKTQHTRFKLSHQHLRDYIMWFTVFGTIQNIYNKKLADKNIYLYLRGLGFESFADEFNTKDKIDPIPELIDINSIKYEKIKLGHYFPDQRDTDKAMKLYVGSIFSSRPYYEYYSKKIYSAAINCSNNISFYLVISVEGYETKRRYDTLLTRRGRTRTDITHTDSERYGIWACKGGVPIQKIDDWIEGSKGIYSYIQAFVDCDDFNLTANRGSINNTDIEKLGIIKAKLNEIFNDPKLKAALNERDDIAKIENQIASIEEDGKQLKERHGKANKNKKIILNNGTTLKEPSRLYYGYSESETMVLLISLLQIYPKLFDFNIMDYNTQKGIDFVVEHNSNPKYIELKGSFLKNINHPFRYIYKFICYDIEATDGDIICDIEDFNAIIKVNPTDKFPSLDDDHKNKTYKSYKLDPTAASIQSMEIINLKDILTTILGAEIK